MIGERNNGEGQESVNGGDEEEETEPNEAREGMEGNQ